MLFEQRTNQLFVSDIPAKLEEITSLIAKIDIPVRQVLIEARIVDADDSFGRALGMKLGYSDLRGPPTSAGANVGGNYDAIGAQTGQIAGPVDFINSQFVNLPANTSSLGGATAATFALSLFGAAANRFLNLELSALEADGKGKIVSSPRVVTADQVEALIEQGTELPYQAATSSGATSVQFRKANLALKVTPQITPEGNVILNVDVNKDSRVGSFRSRHHIGCGKRALAVVEEYAIGQRPMPSLGEHDVEVAQFAANHIDPANRFGGAEVKVKVGGG